jgi:hypothetical protein
MYANFRMRRAHSTDITVLAVSDNVFVMYANFRIEKSSLHKHNSSCNNSNLRKFYSTCIAILLATAITGHQLPHL